MTTPAQATESTLLGGGPPPRPVDTPATKVIVRGEPIAAPAGRSDDFAWPRRGVAPPGTDPVATTTTNPVPVYQPTPPPTAAPAITPGARPGTTADAPPPRPPRGSSVPPAAAASKLRLLPVLALISLSARQRRRSHQELVDRVRALAAFADRPDDQRLAAPHVAGGKHLVDRRAIVVGVGAHIAALIERPRRAP